MPLLRLLLALVLASPLELRAPPALTGQDAPRPEAEATAEIERVIDGDTLEVRLEEQLVVLRLLSVDTEEKITGRASSSPTKPQTVFGQETALWARELFAELGARARLGLAFPEGRRRDGFGRLLCHVLLPDGRDYNLLLVELGKSPYFNKYGNSLIAHEAFLKAQRAARAAQLGIWNPATNRARTSDAPSAVRPYAELLPWWDARAAAIDAFRARARQEPELFVSHEDPAGLQRAFGRCRADAARVTVFAEILRFFEESDGSLTALLREGDTSTALRAEIPAAERADLEPRLRATTAEFRQNYLWVTGRVERNERGFVLRKAGAADWVVAEPAFPEREGK